MKNKEPAHPSVWADAYLTSLIRMLRTHNSTKLPSLRECAKEAGVSTRIMYGAIQRQVAKGILVARQGNGVYLAGITQHDYHPVKKSESKGKWLLHKLIEDIKSGHFPAENPIPSIKELQSTYGTGYRTVKTAINNLVQNNLLEPYNRGYRPKIYQQLTTAASLVLICPADTNNTPRVLEFPYLQESYLYIEEVCRQRRIRLLSFCIECMSGELFDFHGNRVNFNAFYLEGYTLLGMVVFMRGMRYTPMLNDFLAKLKTTNLPVSIYNTPEIAEAEKLIGKRVRVFCTGQSFSAGREMGKFLCTKGHARMVYISPFHHHQEWSQRRLEGLVQAQRELSPNGNVHLVAATYENFEETVSTINRHVYYALAATSSTIQMPSDSMKEVAEKYFNDCMKNSYASIRNGVIFQPLQKCFEQALGYDATVWVCANDDFAIPALAFLKSRGIKVPSQISLVGFDNKIDSMVKMITTYEFNVGLSIRSLVEHCLGNEPYFQNMNSQSIYIDGEIVERSTVARLNT